MFLIQIDQSQFIDGEKISSLDISNGRIAVYCEGSYYICEKDYCAGFLNNLSAIDKNEQPLEMLRNHIKGN